MNSETIINVLISAQLDQGDCGRLISHQSETYRRPMQTVLVVIMLHLH